jgi:hypothetical protein
MQGFTCLIKSYKTNMLGYFSEILFVEEYNICASSYIFFLKIVLVNNCFDTVGWNDVTIIVISYK